MKPRLAQLMTAALIAVAALTACRKEVAPPLPAPDEVPKPNVHINGAAARGGDEQQLSCRQRLSNHPLGRRY
jgi:hypothetical protein